MSLRSLKSWIAAVLVLGAVTACSSGVHVPAAAGASSFAPVPIGSGSALDEGGDTGTEASELASQLGCSDFSTDVQLDRYVEDEATCACAFAQAP